MGTSARTAWARAAWEAWGGKEKTLLVAFFFEPVQHESSINTTLLFNINVVKYTQKQNLQLLGMITVFKPGVNCCVLHTQVKKEAVNLSPPGGELVVGACHVGNP